MAFSKIVVALVFAAAIVSDAIRVDDAENHLSKPMRLQQQQKQQLKRNKGKEEPGSGSGSDEDSADEAVVADAEMFPSFNGFESYGLRTPDEESEIPLRSGGSLDGAEYWQKIADQGDQMHTSMSMGANLPISGEERPQRGHTITDANRETGSITSSMTGYAGDNIAIAEDPEANDTQASNNTEVPAAAPNSSLQQHGVPAQTKQDRRSQ